MKLPTLYKKTSTGAIEQWSIRVEAATSGCFPGSQDQAFDIVTEHGQVGGKLVESRETVREGKNLGKKNATTARQQAESQARSEWDVKLTRKGYVEELARAQAGENNGAGGIRPMLAHKFTDYGDDLGYPCYAQPKLDGIRCIAVVAECPCASCFSAPKHACPRCLGRGTKVTLWSREQKPIVAVPHIAEAITAMNLPAGTVLDGELYNHKLKKNFEKVASCVRKQYAASPEEQALIQYHVYDLPRHPGLPASARFGDRATTLSSWSWAGPLVHVETKLVKSYEALTAYLEDCLARGYEGCVARAPGAYEENKRSRHLLKLKKFDDGEFDILGVYEGKGKMAGMAIFVCSMERGHAPLSREQAQALARQDFKGTPYFGCKLKGELEELRRYLDDETLWKSRQLTVRYQGLTTKRKVCRFPVGHSIRDYE